MRSQTFHKLKRRCKETKFNSATSSGGERAKNYLYHVAVSRSPESPPGQLIKKRKESPTTTTFSLPLKKFFPFFLAAISLPLPSPPPHISLAMRGCIQRRETFLITSPSPSENLCVWKGADFLSSSTLQDLLCGLSLPLSQSFFPPSFSGLDTGVQKGGGRWLGNGDAVSPVFC